jgi:hypothetical protein
METQSTLHRLRNKIVLVIILTIVLFVSSQFVVMATVSTRGNDIGRIRREQEDLRLENEKLRAQISASKTTETILQTLDTKFETKQVRSEILSNDPRN